MATDLPETSDPPASTDLGTDDDSFLRGVAGMGVQSSIRLPPQMVIDETYRIERELGAGGMGVVYLARDLKLHRDVAIKLHAAGGDHPGVGRLLREATAMAQLSHPHVITVHEVGTYQGHPFVVMEYLDGGTARTWLAAQPRTPKEILGLYVAAGRGLAAAHAAGMIHRDFKPDNVLVGLDGRIRVADFGLARPISSTARDTQPTSPGARARRDSAGTVSGETLPQVTQHGQVVGTPGYMAPEQFHGDELGAAADQFAFCVAVWEALCGERPYPGRSARQIHAAIEAGRRRAPPASRPMPRTVRRALERGLARNPVDRFPSMAQLVAELERDPAGPRKRAIAAAAAVLATGAAVTAIATALGGDDPAARCARAGERLAGVWDDGRRAVVRDAFAASGRPDAVATFDRVAERLDRHALRWRTQRTEACRATHVQGDQTGQLLDLRNHCLERRRAELDAAIELLATGDPEVVDRGVEITLGLGDLDLCADVPGLTGVAAPPADPAVGAQLAAIEAELAELRALDAAGQFDRAVTLARSTAARADAVGHAPLIAEARLWLGQLENAVGAHQGARISLEEAGRAAGVARDDRLAAAVWTLLAEILADRAGQLDAAESLLAVASAAVSRAGSPPRLAAGLAAAAGNLRTLQGRYAEARIELERALALEEQVLDADDPGLANTLVRLASVETDLRDQAAARRHLDRAIELLEDAYGPSHPRLASAMNNLGLLLIDEDRPAEALPLLQRVLVMKEASGHRDVDTTLLNLARALVELGRPAEARPHVERALAVVEARYGSAHRNRANALGALAEVEAALGEEDAALAHREEALGITEAELGEQHPDVATLLLQIGQQRLQAGDQGGARRDLERAVAIYEAARGPSDRSTATALAALADAQITAGDYDSGLARYRRALAVFEDQAGHDHPQVGRILLAIGEAELLDGDLEAAVRDVERGRAIFFARFGEAHPEVARAYLVTAGIAERAGRPRDAVPDLERAASLFAQALGAAHPAVADARFRLAMLLWQYDLDRPRAIALAREARASTPRLAGVIDAWLDGKG